MSLKGLSPPHLLLASPNPMRMIQNLNHLLTRNEISKLTVELDRNTLLLFELGELHYRFAANLADDNWRQKISRLYYAVYNVRRSVMLKHSGAFSTDSSDHNSLDKLPDTLNNKEAHISRLRNLREDRNLADYSHLAVMADLVASPDDWLQFATSFISDCRVFLATQGVNV